MSVNCPLPSPHLHPPQSLIMLFVLNFCQFVTNWSHQRGDPQLRNCLLWIGQWVYLWAIFFLDQWHGYIVPGFIGKQANQLQEEKASKQHPSVLFESVLPGSCLGLLWWWMQSISQINPFSPKLPLIRKFYPSNRKQTRILFTLFLYKVSISLVHTKKLFQFKFAFQFLCLTFCLTYLFLHIHVFNILIVEGQGAKGHLWEGKGKSPLGETTGHLIGLWSCRLRLGVRILYCWVFLCPEERTVNGQVILSVYLKDFRNSYSWLKISFVFYCYILDHFKKYMCVYLHIYILLI